MWWLLGCRQLVKLGQLELDYLLFLCSETGSILVGSFWGRGRIYLLWRCSRGGAAVVVQL